MCSKLLKCVKLNVNSVELSTELAKCCHCHKLRQVKCQRHQINIQDWKLTCHKSLLSARCKWEHTGLLRWVATILMMAEASGVTLLTRYGTMYFSVLCGGNTNVTS